MSNRSWNFGHIDFSTYPFYRGDDLGVHYSDEHLQVRIWAPTAQRVEFRLYEYSQFGDAVRIEDLRPDVNGTWILELRGKFEGKYYTLSVTDGQPLNEVPDIYVRATGSNGKRGLIFDPAHTNPVDWQTDQRIQLSSPVDAVIYEVHVRDFSISPDAGFLVKGKFLSFTENGLINTAGQTIGLDHLKELGITHVHLLPVNDFHTVDEDHPEAKYNWGYDPLHYNTPEGSYSTNPDSTSRITEFKQLVQTLHQNGIGVIADVVYNHTGRTRRSVFNQTVPGYFYRQDEKGKFSNASGCGNEIASERAMVRKYIIDSLKYWATEFHMDGFRFDLMGILDLETMNLIRDEMDQISPSILLYGEGWTADQSPLSENYRAVKKNISRLHRIAAFNDDLRDAIKGNNFDASSKGFVSGKTYREENLKFGLVAACYHPQIIYDFVEHNQPAWALEPWQCVNYASCHDNFTLFDKLVLSSPRSSIDEIKKMNMLSAAIVFTAQGIPFIPAGEEFGRSKAGEHNSYNLPDSINQIDWERKAAFADVFSYYRKLIELRKAHPAFRMQKSEQIRVHLRFPDFYSPGLVSFYLQNHANNDPWERILVIFNANKMAIDYPLGKKYHWKIIAKEATIQLDGTDDFYGESISVPPISMLLLASV